MQSRIKKLIKKEGKKGTGYIVNPAGGRDIVFFEDDLSGVSFQELLVNTEVVFEPVERADKRGIMEVIARNITVPSVSVAAQSKNATIVGVMPLNASGSGLRETLAKLVNKPVFSSDWSRFEDDIFLLLRLIGVHALYQFDKRNQKGRPDGFFLIRNLVVIYDCTLDDNYPDGKKDQIENYVNRLNNKGQITISYRRADGSAAVKTLAIQGKTKQVWIVTTGNSRELFEADEVKVKEVSAFKIAEVLKRRLNADKLEEEDVASLLTQIDTL